MSFTATVNARKGAVAGIAVVATVMGKEKPASCPVCLDVRPLQPFGLDLEPALEGTP